MRFVTIIGARPQFIKAAPLSAELRREHTEYLVHTGQHYDENMSDVFFRELDIPSPDVHLGVGSGSHGVQTAAMLEGIERVLLELRPDAVIIYGDTNSTLAGALAASKLHIPVAHIEAGLRSFDRNMPEEINRIVSDHISRWMFVPSQVSVRQLAAEGITQGVHDVGDIMADSVRLFAPIAKERSNIMSRLNVASKDYYLATIHRPANTDNVSRMESILQSFRRASRTVVFPMHPRTRAAIKRHGLEDYVRKHSANNIITTEPLGYLDMLQMQQHASIILTDSGGIQKEAYYLGVPCITLRDTTEWVETVDAGWNMLAGDTLASTVNAMRHFETAQLGDRPLLYGDAHASRRIVQVLNQEGGEG